MGSSLHVPAPPPAAAATTPAPDQTSRQSPESLERPETPEGVETPGTSVTDDIPNLPEYSEFKEHTNLPEVEEPEPFVTPLDVFFTSFPRFPYNSTNSPESSYRQLKKFLRLRKDSAEENAVWQSYQDALVDEIRIWFGNTSDINAWHHLCKAVGVRNPPPEIKDCKKVSGYFLSVAENSETPEKSQSSPHAPLSSLLSSLMSSVCYYAICAVFGLLALHQSYALSSNIASFAYLGLVIQFRFVLLLLCIFVWTRIVLKFFPSRLAALNTLLSSFLF